jgi:multiple sugar transport system substrate-binding protein
MAVEMKTLGAIALVAALLAPVAYSIIFNPAKTDKLVFYFGKDETGVMEDLIDQFETDGAGVKRHVMPPNTDVQLEMVKKALILKTHIDVVRVEYTWIHDLASAGLIEPLDDYTVKDDFINATLEACTYKGKLYAIPLFIDVGLFYYNKGMLDDYLGEGYDPAVKLETWKNVTDIAKDMLANGTIRDKYKNLKYGLVYQGAQYEGLICSFMEFIWSHGGEVVKDGDVVIDSQEAQTALGLMVDMIDDGIVPESVISKKEEDCYQDFMTNRTIFMRNWPYAWENLRRDLGDKLDFGVVPMPKGPNGDHSSALGGWALAIPSHSNRKDDAFALIEHFAKETSQKLLYTKGGYPPALKSAYELEELGEEKRDLLDNLTDVIEYVKPRPTVPEYARVSLFIRIRVHEALLGKSSPEKSLAQAQKDLERVL